MLPARIKIDYICIKNQKNKNYIKYKLIINYGRLHRYNSGN